MKQLVAIILAIVLFPLTLITSALGHTPKWLFNLNQWIGNIVWDDNT